MADAARASTACRACRSPRLETVLDLGAQPPANAFLRADQLDAREPRFPLVVEYCHDCSLVQLKHAVPGDVLFRNYVYNSSTSPVFVKHFQDLARDVTDRFGLAQDAFVVDIGSNDGILLRPFRDAGRRVLGVDPAEAIARMATETGIETWPRFFAPDVAREVVAKRGHADLVTATNSYAHIDDLDGVTEGVTLLLLPRGVFMVEVAYLVDLVEKGLFDTVYHEHLYYWSVKPLQRYAARFGLELFDVQRVETHGGSLRAFFQKKGGPHRVEPTVARAIEAERAAGVHDVRTFHAFAKRVEQNKAALRSMLADLKARGKRIAGYGAPAKGNTLLNHFGIGRETLDYIVDDAPLKQGLYTPGTHVPVVPATTLEERRPDFLVILAWNFAAPIMRKLASFSKAGGAFIVPVPEPHIVEEKP